MKFGDYEIKRIDDESYSCYPYEIIKNGKHVEWGKHYPDALEEIIRDLLRGPFIVEERERKHDHDWSYAGSGETLEEARKIANLLPKSTGVRIIQVAD